MKLTEVSGNMNKVLSLFSRGEAFDAKGFIEFFTDKPLYQFGNFDICFDKPSIQKSADTFFSGIDAVYHDIKKMWEFDSSVFVEMDVTYWRKDGSVISLPCFDIFRIEGDKFSELRIFMDANPVFNPSIEVADSTSVYSMPGSITVERSTLMQEFFKQHPEGKARINAGYNPKWSLNGPKWKV